MSAAIVGALFLAISAPSAGAMAFESVGRGCPSPTREARQRRLAGYCTVRRASAECPRGWETTPTRCRALGPRSWGGFRQVDIGRPPSAEVREPQRRSVLEDGLKACAGVILLYGACVLGSRAVRLARSRVPA